MSIAVMHCSHVTNYMVICSKTFSKIQVFPEKLSFHAVSL